MNTKTFSLVYEFSQRTVQWYLKNNWQELERRNILFVSNKTGKRLKYEILDGPALSEYIIKYK